MGVETGRLDSLTIANGAAVSNGIRITDVQWAGFLIPSAWTVANLFLEFSDVAAPTDADADWREWRNATGVVSFPAGADVYLTTSGELLPFLGNPTWMRACSGPRGGRVNQGGERIIRAFQRRWS